MALSIFMIHLFGDMWSPEIIGRAADCMDKNLQKASLILPGVLLIGALLWFLLALKTVKTHRASQNTHRISS
jgi:hypothetical protein